MTSSTIRSGRYSLTIMPASKPLLTRADLEAAVALQHVGDQLDQFLVVVDDQDLSLAAFQGIGGNAVVAHEREKLIAGDAAKPAARHAESLQLSRIETANDGLLADLADLGRFAGREHSFHIRFTIPWLVARGNQL